MSNEVIIPKELSESIARLPLEDLTILLEHLIKINDAKENEE